MRAELIVFAAFIALSASYRPWNSRPWPIWRGGNALYRGSGVSPMAYRYGAPGYGIAARSFGSVRGMNWRAGYNNYNYLNRYNRGYRRGYNGNSVYYNYFDDSRDEDDFRYYRRQQVLRPKMKLPKWKPKLKAPKWKPKMKAPKWKPKVKLPKWWPRSQMKIPKWRPQILPKWNPFPKRPFPMPYPKKY